MANRGDEAPRMKSTLGANRRFALRGGVALALSGLAQALGKPDAAGAKKRKPRTTYQCSGPGVPSTPAVERIALTFTASQSGTLRQIAIEIVKSSIGAPNDYVVQLVATTDDHAPSNSPIDVLAAAAIPDAAVPVGDSTLVANFAGTRIIKGEMYAVVINRSGGSLGVRFRQDAACIGTLYTANGATAFTSMMSDSSMVVRVRVV